MILLPRRCLLAIAAVVDVALHARPTPVAAKALAARHDLPPRHLETLLQALVRANILKGVRGPRGGYELARERRRISAAEIVRAALVEDEEEAARAAPESRLLSIVVAPLVEEAGKGLLASLDAISVEDLCRRAEDSGAARKNSTDVDFTI
jgi:Rrf2 family iron-sulfur cluster assembly transcriptional regulator